MCTTAQAAPKQLTRSHNKLPCFKKQTVILKVCVIGKKKHWMIEKDKQIRRIRRTNNKKNNESNQIVWMGFIKQKTTKNMHSSAV